MVASIGFGGETAGAVDGSGLQHGKGLVGPEGRKNSQQINAQDCQTSQNPQIDSPQLFERPSNPTPPPDPETVSPRVPASNARADTDSQGNAEDTLDEGPSQHFDWHDPDNVLIPEQPAIAIYPNAGGTLTIRQRQWPEDDIIIVVNFECLPSLIEGLQRYQVRA